jgi:hypothetical protein
MVQPVLGVYGRKAGLGVMMDMVQDMGRGRLFDAEILVYLTAIEA